MKKLVLRTESYIEHPPYFLELELTRLVSIGNFEQAWAIIERINVFKRAQLAPDPIRSLKNSLICNCAFLARAAIAGGVPYEEAFALSDELILELESGNSLPTIQNLEKNHLRKFVFLVNERANFKFSKAARLAIAYINLHLSEPLTLSAIAEAAGLSPSYLSALFHKETQTKLFDYISAKRIESAKFFLRHTYHSVSEIANHFQFSSHSHFSRRFYQIVGVTPLAFRNGVNINGI